MLLIYKVCTIAD